jgi:hypothetical protein
MVYTMKVFFLFFTLFFTLALFPSGMAFAERNAVFFIEMEHEDSDEQAVEEVATVYCFNMYLSKKYSKFYWLINNEATKDGFFETMRKAVNESTTVDLYILAHGGMQFFWGHFDDRIYVDDIISLKSFENMNHLRLVYLGSCHSWDLTDEFIEAGARSVIGSDIKMNNFPFLPSFLYNFGVRGFTLKYSVSISQGPLDSFLYRGDGTIRMTSQK